MRTTFELNAVPPGTDPPTEPTFSSRAVGAQLIPVESHGRRRPSSRRRSLLPTWTTALAMVLGGISGALTSVFLEVLITILLGETSWPPGTPLLATFAALLSAGATFLVFERNPQLHRERLYEKALRQ